MVRWAARTADGGAPGAEAVVAILARHGEIVPVVGAAGAAGAAGCEALVVLGGSGGLAEAAAAATAGVRVVHVPAAVENDVAGSDLCLGVDSALNAILRAAAESKGPTILDVPGRLTGYLALMGAAGAGAAGALLVERPFPWDRLGAALKAGARPILVRSEGAGSGADAAARLGALTGGAPAAVVDLRAALRAGSPSIFDLQVAHRLAEAAAELLKSGGGGKMIAWRGGRCIPVPLAEVAGHRRQVLPEVFEFAKARGVLFE